MKTINIFLLVFLAGCLGNKKSDSVSGNFSIDSVGGNLEIRYEDKHLTTLNLADSPYKPFFWPVNTLNGISVTRGYPFKPVKGEPVDHPHQTGIWFNYGDINKLDFWNNSNAIPTERKQNYGRIEADSFKILKNNSPAVAFELYSSWRNNQGVKLISEKTIYTLETFDSSWALTRNTYLIADTLVRFGDNKEGLFAIRLAREFQFDTGKADYLVDDDGTASGEKKIMDEGKNGMYFGSNGTKGNDTWATSNEWVQITTFKDGDSVSVMMMDHPGNIGFPALWHARNYGLFSVNNLGRKAYRPELPEFNMELKKAEALNLKHKIIIRDGGSFRKEEIEKQISAFHSLDK